MAPAALPPFEERPVDPGCERHRDGAYAGDMGRVVVPLPVVLALVLLMAACTSAPPPAAPGASAGIRKVEAQVRGIT